MNWQVKWTDNATRKLEKFNFEVRQRILKKVEASSRDPYLYSKKMIGAELWIIRAGDYRVIFAMENKMMVILIVDVDHRSRIYQKY